MSKKKNRKSPDKKSNNSELSGNTAGDSLFPFKGYLVLNLIFWGFCILQVIVLRFLIGDVIGIMFFFLVLGAGFTIVSVFDFAYDRIAMKHAVNQQYESENK